MVRSYIARKNRKMRRTLILATLLVVVLTLAKPLLFLNVEGQESTVRVKEVTMTAYYWRFEPSTIVVSENDTVRLKIACINNMMPMMAYMFPNHGIEIDDYIENTTLPVGETVTIEFVANKTGTFHFHCTIFCGMGHEDMHGELIVNGANSNYIEPSNGKDVLGGVESWVFLPPVLFLSTIFAIGYILFSKTRGKVSVTTKTDERPVAAFTLSLVGVALQMVAGAFVTSMMFFTPFPGPWMMWTWMSGSFTWSYGWTILWAGLAIIMTTLGILGALWMNSSDLYRVHTGSTLVLIAAVLAFPTMWGFMIGSLLMFIGSILGLTWQPMEKRRRE